MNKSLAQFTSYVFHPVFIPVYVILLLLRSDAYFAVLLDERFKRFLVFFTITTAVILPLLSASLLKRLNLLSSLQMPRREERILPFVASAVFYFIAFMSLQKIEHLSGIYSLLFLSTAGLILITAGITYFWKISIHLISIGSAAGILFALLLNGQMDFRLWFLLALLTGGWVGAARLTLKAHKPSQVYIGFLLGFLFMFFIFFQ
jgi:hypothetical protein